MLHLEALSMFSILIFCMRNTAVEIFDFINIYLNGEYLLAITGNNLKLFRENNRLI